eukprot:171009-Prymnesium_polylepis.2
MPSVLPSILCVSPSSARRGSSRISQIPCVPHVVCRDIFSAHACHQMPSAKAACSHKSAAGQHGVPSHAGRDGRRSRVGVGLAWCGGLCGRCLAPM